MSHKSYTVIPRPEETKDEEITIEDIRAEWLGLCALVMARLNEPYLKKQEPTQDEQALKKESPLRR